jgi:hypothetical protein
MLSSSFYLGYTTMHKKMPTIPTGRQVEVRTRYPKNRQQEEKTTA